MTGMVAEKTQLITENFANVDLRDRIWRRFKTAKRNKTMMGCSATGHGYISMSG